MTPEDIKKFKEETADPVMNKVLEKVELKEGQVIIDGIRITVSDGRSYGFDTLFQLKGLTISNGKVVDFAEEFADVPMEEFLAVLSEYTVGNTAVSAVEITLFTSITVLVSSM